MRETWIGRRYLALVDRCLMPLAERMGMTPDRATVAGLLLALMVPLGFLWHPLAGTALILGSGVADSMDGMLARRQGSSSVYGAFFDSCLDRISDGFYLAGIWVLFWPDHHPLAGGLMMTACMIASFLVSYSKARAESLGVPLSGGMMERAARTVYLVVWSLALAMSLSGRGMLLWTGAAIFLMLTAGTAAGRMRRARRLMKAGGPVI
jgi:CDP-diacylglycerol---glycerol-3-phosphate 3-phosphatidyltransferase